MKKKTESKGILRHIPSVDKVLNWEEVKKYHTKIEQRYLTIIVRYTIDEFRKRVVAGEKLTIEHLKQSIIQELHDITHPYFCYAINALGIVLHTGLGRAPLSKGIADVMHSVALGFSRLQIDEEGKRADRYKKINQLLHILTGAEAGIIVNNNAAATLIILSTMAQGKEVVVSRGQLIEIGGAFRIPEIMAQSGAIMREVGTTNRTHLRDYEGAIDENTAALLRVHQSNYRILGFTKEVPLEELVELGKKYNVPVIDDLGSGALIDFSKYGLPKEPMVQESIKTGADVVCFSGDKLIAGPQCGIILGKKKFVDAIKKNPLTRAMRCDKFTNAALEATLQLFLTKEKNLIKNQGVLGILLKQLPNIKRHATRCASSLKKQFGTKLEISVKEDVSEIGGGSLSTEELPTYVVAIKSKKMAAQDLARALRLYRVPIYGRVSENRLLLDFRTVLEGEEKIIIQAFKDILSDT